MDKGEYEKHDDGIKQQQQQRKSSTINDNAFWLFYL